jgi:LacI family transcriptional regulator, repressor for deo operon, udp, cdd, tsx, nupC, and nupG
MMQKCKRFPVLIKAIYFGIYPVFHDICYILGKPFPVISRVFLLWLAANCYFSELSLNPQASMDQVAQLAGVSAATVSRVMTGSKPVSAQTRRRVDAAIAQLGYRANAFGRSLSTGESRLLLVLVPDFANPYYAEIISGAATVARHSGYTLLPVDLEESWSHTDGAQSHLYSSLTDGVINLVPIVQESAMVETARRKPWVNCSEFLPESEVPYVSIDHRQAACDAVQYLINQGHSRIALINSDERFLYARQRREGYELALQRAGIALRPELVRMTGSTSYLHGSQAAAALLATAQPPSAVFAVSDMLAVGAIKAFRRANMRVPNDIAVVGFDDIPIAEVFEPALTTIAQPMQQLGAVAVELLLKRLAGERPESRILSYALTLRESA